MKNTRSLLWLMVFGLLGVYGCGGTVAPDSELSVSISVPISDDAVALAVAVTAATFDAHASSTPRTLITGSWSKIVTRDFVGNDVTFDLSDELVSVVAGGTFTLNGSAVIQNYNELIKTTTGHISAAFQDVSKAVDYNDQSYDVVLSGTVNFDYVGTLESGDTQATGFVSDITYTTTGTNLTLTGTVSGTITNLEQIRQLKLVDVGEEYQQVSTCTGAMTVTTDTGTWTCAFQSDCEACEEVLEQP